MIDLHELEKLAQTTDVVFSPINNFCRPEEYKKILLTFMTEEEINNCRSKKDVRLFYGKWLHEKQINKPKSQWTRDDHAQSLEIHKYLTKIADGAEQSELTWNSVATSNEFLILNQLNIEEEFSTDTTQYEIERDTSTTIAKYDGGKLKLEHQLLVNYSLMTKTRTVSLLNAPSIDNLATKYASTAKSLQQPDYIHITYSHVDIHYQKLEIYKITSCKPFLDIQNQYENAEYVSTFKEICDELRKDKKSQSLIHAISLSMISRCHIDFYCPYLDYNESLSPLEITAALVCVAQPMIPYTVAMNKAKELMETLMVCVPSILCNLVIGRLLIKRKENLEPECRSPNIPCLNTPGLKWLKISIKVNHPEAKQNVALIMSYPFSLIPCECQSNNSLKLLTLNMCNNFNPIIAAILRVKHNDISAKDVTTASAVAKIRHDDYVKLLNAKLINFYSFWVFGVVKCQYDFIFSFANGRSNVPKLWREGLGYFNICLALMNYKLGA